MSKIRCKECRKIGEEKEGFCPECGALYTPPFEYITDEDAELDAKQRQIVEKSPKQKKSGFFDFLKKKFTIDDRTEDEETEEETSQEAEDEDVEEASESESKPITERKIRCNQCRAISTGIGDGYCSECGAIFVPPYNFVDQEKSSKKKRAENKRLIESLAIMKKASKPFEEMTTEEKVTFLKEQIEDLRDKTVTQRHFLTEKANECMQCFTSAGSIRSNDYDQVLGSIIKRRQDNLEEFELTFIEYKRMLDELQDIFEQMQNAKKVLSEFQTKP